MALVKDSEEDVFFISCYWINHPDERNLKEKEFAWAHCLRVHPVMAGTGQQEEQEAAGHTASGVRNQRDRCWFLACSLHL